VKKRLSGCSECGDDTAILTQVSSGLRLFYFVLIVIISSIQMKHKIISVMKKKKVKKVKIMKVKIKKSAPNFSAHVLILDNE